MSSPKGEKQTASKQALTEVERESEATIEPRPDPSPSQQDQRTQSNPSSPYRGKIGLSQGAFTKVDKESVATIGANPDLMSSQQEYQTLSNPSSNHTSSLAEISAAQIQTHQQMMLMAQMIQMSQQQFMGGNQCGTNAPHGLAQLMSLHQQQQGLAQINLLESIRRANNAVNSIAPNTSMDPAQRQMMPLSGFSGNINGVFPNSNQIQNNIHAASGTSSLNAAAVNGPQTEEVMNDPGWEDQYKALQRYKLVNGHTKVPARYKENPKLGRWVMTQVSSSSM